MTTDCWGFKMGGALSNFFQSGHALLSSSHNRAVSEQTRRNMRIVFDALCANPKVTQARLDGLLSVIPRGENILQIHNEEGYNLLQKVVGLNNLEMIRWCLTRNVDINRGACSLPLHIACLKGFEDAVELLLKNGARVDVEARMCWPGPHQQNCEERVKHSRKGVAMYSSSSDKLQCAIYYAIDGDQVDILELLAQQGEDHWLPWQQKRPLLHIACERAAWNCVKYLVSERSDEINQCYDEYYPIHHAALHDIKFLELLIQCGAETQVRTSTQLMTALHVVLLMAKKTAEDTLQTVKLLMDNGLRILINEADSLGNTPLHVLIARYALEERKLAHSNSKSYGYHDDHQPWNKWDMLHIVRYLLQNGARPAINHGKNSALACVLRQVSDWEFRYDLLAMLLQEGGDPNVEGRDGSVPLMVCLVPLVNRDPLHHFNHNMKVCYLNCVRILCKYGANPNCSNRSDLTPLHVLVFMASENIALNKENEKQQGFEFVRNLLTLLLQHGLDPNVRFSQRSSHILLSLMDMVQNARLPTDLGYVYDLTLTLIQYGADPNVNISTKYDSNVEDYEPMDSYEHGHRRREIGGSNSASGVVKAHSRQSHHHYAGSSAHSPHPKHGLSSSYISRPSTNHVLYYYVQLLMNKDKLISSNYHLNHNSNSHVGSISHSSGSNYGEVGYGGYGKCGYGVGGINLGGGGAGGETGPYQSQQMAPGSLSSQTYQHSLTWRLNPATSAASSGGGIGMSYISGGATGGPTGNNGEGTINSDGSRSNGSSVECEMHFARIIKLYYMCMYHTPLYACLKLLYSQQNPNNPNKSALYNVIRDLCSKPRTLKQMSRVIIYNAVGQRPALTVNKLPLPTALREYVLSFEP